MVAARAEDVAANWVAAATFAAYTFARSRRPAPRRHRAIAAALNAQGIRMARGGAGHNLTVRNLLARQIEQLDRLANRPTGGTYSQRDCAPGNRVHRRQRFRPSSASRVQCLWRRRPWWRRQDRAIEFSQLRIPADACSRAWSADCPGNWFPRFTCQTQAIDRDELFVRVGIRVPVSCHVGLTPL
jgi:hypothetical protein